MRNMSKKGITIIEIVIVIIILILLAVIAIYNANKPLGMAQVAAYNQEFRSLYSALSYMKDRYNNGLIDLDEGEYFYSSFERDGDTWYTIYGLNQTGISTDTGFIETNEHIIENLGLSELKFSYEYSLRNESANKDDIKIKLLGDDYIDIKGYKIRTYDEMQELLESGAI